MSGAARDHCIRIRHVPQLHPLNTPPSLTLPIRPTILAVDDARAVRIIAQRVLSNFDCDVREATNGYNALFAMEQALPSLILLDVNMPVMGGVEMLTLLKSKPELKTIPVIMLTSPADHPVMGQIKTLGVSATLMKPFNETALLEKIRGVLVLNAK
jgi:CheY-like chemotaxis protein